MKEDDNGDDDNDYGEEWMENPLIYNKVLSWIMNWKIIVGSAGKRKKKFKSASVFID